MDERQAYVDIARRLLQLVETGSTDSAPDVYRLPTSVYTDPELFEREKQTIFKDNPQLVCFSGDLPEPGSYYTFDDLGVPGLLTRDQGGQVHAFLNSCPHRAARLKDGCGKSPSISCPYHGWGFDLKGKLRGIYEEKTFGQVDKSCYDLLKLPVEEKYGLIYVGLDPDLRFSIDEILGDMAPLFAQWGFDRVRLVGTHEWHLKTNWKLALDTFCEGYHFHILHKKSLGDVALGNVAGFDRFGPGLFSHRLAFPNTTITRLKDSPESEWTTDIFSDFQLVHFIYPNISLLVSPAAIEFFQLYPGEKVGEHVTRYRCYWREECGEAGWGVSDPKAHFEYVRDIVSDEDYWISAGVMKSLNGKLQRYNTFGRNEPALHNMHRAFAEGVAGGADGAQPVQIKRA